jgi:hypothetical protein
MRTGELDWVENVWSVAPFKLPSNIHPDGTLLIAPAEPLNPPRIVEVDIATLGIVQQRVLPVKGSSVRIAATQAGVVAVVHESSPEGSKGPVAFVMDPALRVQKTLRVPGETANVHADGTLAAIAAHAIEGHGAIMAVRIPSGTVAGSRKISGPLSDEWLEPPQIVVRKDRIFTLSRGTKHYVLRALSADLAKVWAEERLPGSSLYRNPLRPQDPLDPVWGDGGLVAAPRSVLVLRSGATEEYDFELESKMLFGSKIADLPHRPAVDPVTGRVLFATGESATSLVATTTHPVVAFRHDGWKWDSFGADELEHNEPVEAFFVNGKGVIVTKYPKLRVTVLEWKSPPSIPEPAVRIRID